MSSPVPAPSKSDAQRWTEWMDRGLEGERRRSVAIKWVMGELALADGDLAAAERAFAAGEPEFRPGININVVFGWPAPYSNAPFRDGPARIQIARGNLQNQADAVLLELAEARQRLAALR